MAIELKDCEYCGKDFIGTKRGKYCSTKCRVYANRIINKERAIARAEHIKTLPPELQKIMALSDKMAEEQSN